MIIPIVNEDMEHTELSYAAGWGPGWGASLVADKESACNVGDLGSSPGLGRSPGEGNSYPFQHSGVKNSMDCIAYGMAKSPTQLSNFHFFTFTLLGEYEWGNHSKKLFRSIYQSKTYMMYDSSIQLSSTDTCTQQYVHKYTKKKTFA